VLVGTHAQHINTKLSSGVRCIVNVECERRLHNSTHGNVDVVTKRQTAIQQVFFAVLVIWHVLNALHITNLIRNLIHSVQLLPTGACSPTGSNRTIPSYSGTVAGPNVRSWLCCYPDGLTFSRAVASIKIGTVYNVPNMPDDS
jgi:hypothetical protein